MNDPAATTGIVSCLVLAKDYQGYFIKAIVAGQMKPVCRRSDLGVTRFVKDLESQGLSVPLDAAVRRPSAGHADTVANCIAAEADKEGSESSGPRPF